MALVLPNRTLGKAFYSQPLHNTNTLAANTIRTGFGGRSLPELVSHNP